MPREHHPSPRGRILLVEDDPDTARFISSVLEKRGGYQVEHAPSPPAALPRLDAERWDLIITDIEMPDMTGIELLETVRSKAPKLPVAVITAHVTVDNAVGALRGRADEFMQKPLHPDNLLTAASRLIERGRSGRESVLAVGAHPDDVEIGAAGALLAHRAAGHDVAILTMSRGARGGADSERAGEARDAAAILGAELYLEDMEDTRISESDPTISAIRAVVQAVQPTVVYTHSIHDVHQDHRNTHRAVMVAAREIGSVYCYQSPSATVDFRPARFVTIDDYITTKLAAIGAFGSQVAVRQYLEPDLIEATARYWSRFGGGKHAEAFEVVRDQPVGPALGWMEEEAAALEVTVRENAADEDAALQILEAGHAIT
jgi:two-component system, NtrC family, response regulator HydG